MKKLATFLSVVFFLFVFLFLPLHAHSAFASSGAFTIDRWDWVYSNGTYSNPIQCYNQGGNCQYIAHISNISPSVTGCSTVDFKNASGGNIRDTFACSFDGSELYIFGGDFGPITDPGETGINGQFIIHDCAGNEW